MRNFGLLLLFLTILLCGVRQAAWPDETQTGTNSEEKKPEQKSPEEKKKKSVKGPRIVLSAFPRQGFMPMRVSLNAVVEGVDENDEKYYCQREEWDFGDGAVSSEQPNCETFTKDTKVNLHFFVEHLYENYGTYTIRFSLGDPVKLRSNQISVLVLEREMGR